MSGPDEDPKTVRDIIRLIAEKWDLRQREVEVCLCFSPADIVQKDLRHLPKFDKASSLKAKLQDIIKHEKVRKDQPIYMLYDIKKPSLEDTSESVDTEEEEELNQEDSEDEQSSDSASDRPEKDEDQVYYEMFTDLLSLILLKKKGKEEASEEQEVDMMKDSQMIPVSKLDKPQEVEDASSMCESEMPLFA